jgi:transcriptional regulator NrdR family protein
MRCPKCNLFLSDSVCHSAKSQADKIGVLESRDSKNNSIRRRYQCKCGHRFSTRERIVLDESDSMDEQLNEVLNAQ